MTLVEVTVVVRELVSVVVPLVVPVVERELVMVTVPRVHDKYDGTKRSSVQPRAFTSMCDQILSRRTWAGVATNQSITVTS